MLVMNPRKKYTLVAAISATLLILLHFHDGTQAALSDYYYRAKQTDSTLHHLIVVPCHGIWKPSSEVLSPLDPASWWFGNDQHQQSSTFVAHIERAVTLLKRDPAAVLVFSGGQTQLRAGPIGEGQSYLMLAERLYKGATHVHKSSQLALDALATRATSEDYARDSYENLLFSIARFYEFTGRYPQQITIVGYKFKQARFINLHATALHYPADRVRYIGIDGDDIDSQAAAEGEHVHAYEPFTNDPYGCTDQQLTRKRIARNPFHRQPPYAANCPGLAPFFNVCADPEALPPTYKVNGFPVDIIKHAPDEHTHNVAVTEEELEEHETNLSNVDEFAAHAQREKHVKGHEHVRKPNMNTIHGVGEVADLEISNDDQAPGKEPKPDAPAPQKKPKPDAGHGNGHGQGLRKQRLQLERKLEAHIPES